MSARSIGAARAAGAPTIDLPALEMSEAEVRAHLGSGSALGAKASWIHLSAVRPDGGLGVRLDAGRERNAFVESVKPLGGGWCCVEAETRGAFGHFWYDALWDVEHTDRFQRRWSPSSRPWEPTPGP